MANDEMLAFRAEKLLGADAEIFQRITALRNGFQYASNGQKTSFDAYFALLREDVDGIPRLALDVDVPPGTENQYSIHLAKTMEQIVDDSDRVQRKLAHFQGLLREAERQISNLMAEFVAWYLIAAGPLVKSAKLPAKVANRLAEAEFSRCMGNSDIRVMALLDDVKIEFSRVVSHKQAQREKHELGTDQANASWSSTLPSFGGAISEDRSPLTREQDIEEEGDEDVPSFVSRATSRRIGSPPVQASPQIAGVFKKTITATMQPIAGEDGRPIIHSADELAAAAAAIRVNHISPRKKLIIDDEAI